MRSRTDEQAEIELKEMAETIAAEKAKSAGARVKESLLHRKYVIPFVLACIILACNQATGVNSIIGLQRDDSHSGRPERFLGAPRLRLFYHCQFYCHRLAPSFWWTAKAGNFCSRWARAGVIVSLVCAGLLFHKTEKLRVDCKNAVQAMVTTNQTLALAFNQSTAAKLLAEPSASSSTLQHFDASTPLSLVIIYSYGDFQRRNSRLRAPMMQRPSRLKSTRDDCVPANKVDRFFQESVRQSRRRAKLRR